jgi:hypothetical protein
MSRRASADHPGLEERQDLAIAATGVDLVHRHLPRN